MTAPNAQGVLQLYEILRAADDYAAALVRLARSAESARRLGDSPARVDTQRKAARDRFAARLAIVLHTPAPDDQVRWTKWFGGDRPVGECTEVIAILRSGATSVKPASGFDWLHEGSASDIVAYRVASD